MAKVKDRLIFEKKKIEAVTQRKANKEQKLRAKETQTNKALEKSRKKREHFHDLETYKSSSDAQRRLGLDRDEDFQSSKQSPNKKRMAADRKYGYGGKRGRFKKTDPSTLNDLSGFNPRGNFAGKGMKKTSASSNKAGGRPASGGKKRQGKRARDASRTRR
jgi:rRNA-processing protein EBP2